MGGGGSIDVATTILVGVFSGIAGSVIGPVLLRTFARSDKALQARQNWAREKLKLVFGSEERYATDGEIPSFEYLVPPTAYRTHHYNMHNINPSVEESIDLRLYQPARSALARRWLITWMWSLQHEYQAVHKWWELQSDYPSAFPRATDFDVAAKSYERRVRRVQTSLMLWATGQWTRPSLALWLSASRLAGRIRARRTKGLHARVARLRSS